MPIFARTKLILYDVCFKTDPGDITLKYVGPNAQKLYQKAFHLIKSVWRASDADIQEENYNWTKGESTKFKVRFILHKDLDKFSFFWIKFDVKAEGNEKTGKGSVVIKPVMVTEYPQDTIWQRSLLYEMLRTFWHRVFYHNKRFEYITECRNLSALYAKKIKEYFEEIRAETED